MHFTFTIKSIFEYELYEPVLSMGTHYSNALACRVGIFDDDRSDSCKSDN
jgi:hypothetical protein